MKHYSFARKRRQVKFLAKQIRKGIHASGGQWTNKLKRLFVKVKNILDASPQLISRRGFRKVLGTAVFLFGLGISPAARAQNFAFPESTPFGLDTIHDYAFPTLVDLDADGDLDLFVGQYGDKNVYSNYQSNFLAFENTGTLETPVFGKPIANPSGTMIPLENYFSMPAFADLDADGDQDLLSGSYYGAFYFYENIGTASVSEFSNLRVNPFSLDSVVYFSSPVFADLDADGDFDLIAGTAYFNEVADKQYGKIMFFQNIGTSNAPTFATPVANPFGLVLTNGFNIPSLGDLDEDGDLDIISGVADGNVVYFENTGSPTAPQFASPVTNPFGFVSDSEANVLIPELFDIDNDGDLDIFALDGYGVGKFYENSANNPVGLKEITPAFDLDVFPNPVQDKLVIRTAEEIDQIEVFDLLGRRLEVFQAIGNTIVLADFQSGIYTLRVRYKNGNFMLTKIQKI